MNIIHLLMINLYGPNDNFDLDTSHVIPALIRKFHEAKVLNKPCVEIWGSGNVSREFLYVEDASNAIFLSLKNYNSIKPINIGNGKEIKIHKLAEIISNVVNYKGAINYNSSKPEGQKRRCLDISLAKEHLGFNAKVDLLTGIKKTYNFFLDNYTSN